MRRRQVYLTVMWTLLSWDVYGTAVHQARACLWARQNWSLVHASSTLFQHYVAASLIPECLTVCGTDIVAQCVRVRVCVCSSFVWYTLWLSVDVGLTYIVIGFICVRVIMLYSQKSSCCLLVGDKTRTRSFHCVLFYYWSCVTCH